MGTDILSSIAGSGRNSLKSDDAAIPFAIASGDVDYISTALNISPAEARALRDAATTQNQINDILKGANKLDKTNGRAHQYAKSGNFETAKQDFYSLNPTNVQKRNNGTITGELPDGRQVNVRPSSRSEKPTIEIQNTPNNYTKIRYGD